MEKAYTELANVNNGNRTYLSATSLAMFTGIKKKYAGDWLKAKKGEQEQEAKSQ